MKLIRYKQGGFTLIELLVVTAVLAIAAAAMTPLVGVVRSYQKTAADDQENLLNQQIADALLAFARSRGGADAGRVPDHYTLEADDLYHVPFNPDATAGEQLLVRDAFARSGIPLNKINDDGSAARNQRVYIRIDATASVPLNNSGAGPFVTVAHDLAVVYSTRCPVGDASCLSGSGATRKPGPSVYFGTGTNYQTFRTTDPDGQAVYLSTLPLQMELVKSHQQRLDEIRKAFVSFYDGQRSVNGGSVATNWFPNQAGASAAGTLSGASPATNAGCRDGWYDLSSTHAGILAAIGLPTSYGSSPWGQNIQYCRDYDPSGLGVANQAPHYAAIRFNTVVTSPVDTATAGNNTVIPF